jgi:hypothetical protein
VGLRRPNILKKSNRQDSIIIFVENDAFYGVNGLFRQALNQTGYTGFDLLKKYTFIAEGIRY